MEGSYLPGKQRAKLALQGRKSHFILGKSENPFSTTQNSFFKTFVPSISPQNYSGFRTASHFTLGNDNAYRNSEFCNNYRVHSIEPRKPKPKVIDLTPSSVVMGKQNMTFLPTSGAFKVPNPNQAQSYSNSPSKNRKHNFELGTDSPTKASVMHSEFSPVRAQPTERIDRGLLDSHIIMGGHPSMYKSVAVNEYSKKVGSPGKLPVQKVNDLKKEHFILGNDDPALVSNQNTSYKPIISSKQGLTNEQLQNLKSSHFSFKAESPDYVSSSKMTMKYSPTEMRNQEIYLKQNHVNFGNDKDNHVSNYTKNHVLNYNPARSRSVNDPTRTKNDEMASDVIFGVTTPNMTLTSNSFNAQEGGSPGKLDPRVEKHLRSHHYTLGNSTNIYEQSHKNWGVGNPDPSRPPQGLKEGMVATHWVTGYHQENLNTSTKREYKSQVAEKREIEKYLKKHNHNLGNSSNSWRSSYNGTFQWIQPVPDNSSKFSFD